jgi:hypothetical protein
MATPVGGVNPGRNPFAGGSITRAGRPTGIGGEFAPVGATGFPTPSAGQIAVARNNSGSNVRIPYSRVVPMHGKDKLPVRDARLAGTGVSHVYEYDGLEAGELAWVMSKQFAILPSSSGVGAMENAVQQATLVSSGANANMLSAKVLADFVAEVNTPNPNPSPNNPLAHGGLHGLDGSWVSQDANGGYGPDRMQRMAYTNWVEAFFEHRISTQTIALHTLRVLDASQHHSFLDSDISYYGGLKPKLSQSLGPRRAGRLLDGGSHLDGATVLCVPDLAYALQAPPWVTGSGLREGQAPDLGPAAVNEMQVQVPMMQGLFVMEKGPFLRTYGAENSTVTICVDDAETGGRTVSWAPDAASGGNLRPVPANNVQDVPRHLGSCLAQKALYCALKKQGVFNWVPDGVCLSKYATGPDGYADDAFDAQSGQLFNVGVQGPCITKTWAQGNSAMHAMPGDRVFMLVVGTVSYELETSGSSDPAAEAARKLVGLNALHTAHVSAAKFTASSPQKENNPKINSDCYETVPTGAQNDLNEIVWKSSKQLASAFEPSSAGTVDDELSQTKELKKVVQSLDNLKALGHADDHAPGTYESLYEVAQSALGVLAARTGDYARGCVATEEFGNTAAGVRNGSIAVAKAQLANIRLVRASSSYLANTSHFDHTNPKSRCGLKIGHLPNEGDPSTATRNPGRAKDDTDQDPGSGQGDKYQYYLTAEDVEAGVNGGHQAAKIGMRKNNAVVSMPMPDTHEAPSLENGGTGSGDRPALTGQGDYILGGWCVGTVMDSAASRAMMHAQQVRTAQSSMAINVNVNVEWWDADKLHAHYMDVDRGHYAEGPHPSAEVAKKAVSTADEVVRQVPESTVLQRDQTPIRSVDSYVRELYEGHVQTRNGATPADITERRKLAAARLTSGEGEYEGRYVRPDPRGVDTDPHGKFVFDQRMIQSKDDPFLFDRGSNEGKWPENRIWETAQSTVRLHNILADAAKALADADAAFESAPEGQEEALRSAKDAAKDAYMQALPKEYDLSALREAGDEE